MFKTGVSDVRVDVQVTEGKNLVNGLSKDDFVVTDENQPQSIVSFSHGEERLNLILLLDISGSMEKYIDEIAQTARESLEHLRPGDRVAIMVFARTSALHQGFSDNLAETARQIASAVKVDVGTSTLINSAVMDAAHYMEANAGTDGRRAILILTDNLSMSFQLTDGQVIRELNKADTVFNAIVTGRAIRPRPLEPGKIENPDSTPADVFHLSEETGGEWVEGRAGQCVLQRDDQPHKEPLQPALSAEAAGGARDVSPHRRGFDGNRAPQISAGGIESAQRVLQLSNLVSVSAAAILRKLTVMSYVSRTLGRKSRRRHANAVAGGGEERHAAPASRRQVISSRTHRSAAG